MGSERATGIPLRCLWITARLDMPPREPPPVPPPCPALMAGQSRGSGRRLPGWLRGRGQGPHGCPFSRPQQPRTRQASPVLDLQHRPLGQAVVAAVGVHPRPAPAAGKPALPTTQCYTIRLGPPIVMCNHKRRRSKNVSPWQWKGCYTVRSVSVMTPPQPSAVGGGAVCSKLTLSITHSAFSPISKS